MKTSLRAPFNGVVILILCLMTAVAARAQTSIQDRFASAGDVRLHYLIAGKGEPVILLHGYAQNSHMWRPLMVELAKTRLVIAPDLRGFGQSSKPNGGYDKKTMAQDIHASGFFARVQTGKCRRSRYRVDGCVCVRRAISN
jgi:alpha-beta hydrolase superfamily lysophospholipase